MTYFFNNVYLHEKYLVGSKLEYEGPLGVYLDEVFTKKCDSFEDNEIEMLKRVLEHFKKENGLVIGGNLSNQLALFYYALKDYNFDPIGVYSACSTMNLSVILSSLLIEGNQENRILSITSSCNQMAERQFRFPNEYGGQKQNTQTFTSNIAAGVIIASKPSSIRISAATIGKIVDVDFKNSCDFGRVMAPSAIETIIDHLSKVNRKPNNYDLILTGDLSLYGSKLVYEELSKEYGNIKNYNDCGLMIYDLNKQHVFAGGSGPGTQAFVMLGYVYEKLLKKEYKRVLICATGALMNQDMVAQKRSIPGICHAVELEVSI